MFALPLRSLFALAAISATTLPGTAQAAIDDGWPIVAATADTEARCSLTVSGNGQFYRIAATGYAPNGKGRLLLANADMTPIDRAVRIDGFGNYADYYLPFLWHHAGGTVSLTLASPQCSLSVDFPWTRAAPVAR